MEWVSKIIVFSKESQIQIEKILQAVHYEFKEVIKTFNRDINGIEVKLRDETRQLCKRLNNDFKCKKCLEKHDGNLQKVRNEINEEIEEINVKFGARIDEFNKTLQKQVENVGKFYREAYDTVSKAIEKQRKIDPKEIPKVLHECVRPLQQKFEDIKIEFGERVTKFTRQTNGLIRELAKMLLNIELEAQKKYDEIGGEFKISLRC